MDRLRLANTHSIMERTLWIGLWGLLLSCSIVNGVPYSKYGRTCKDIGCMSNEVCVMAEDPCTFRNDKCGYYPTCTKRSDAEAQSCASRVCPSGQYCKTINGHATCVNTNSNLGYDSAGVSSVNGQRTNTDHNFGSSSVNNNPYANANAPPPDPSHDTNYHPVNSATNNGYPQYPSSSGNSGYGGYPRPPSSGVNLGYPPYPTQNRMPQPGGYQPSSHYPAGHYPGYSSNQQPGYQYPNYPSGQNPYSTNSKRYPSAAVSHSPHILSFCFIGLLVMIREYLL